MMEMYLRLLLISLLLLLPGSDKSPQEAYIEKYSQMAVEEMYRSGVPASITLAQGMIESRFGLSELAAEGNNHFGIKCHSDWTGKSMKVDDDAKGECFRVYKDASQSFKDHSDFLRYRQRYQFLFELDATDYKGWAYGLSKAGYATDPSYPQKLIRTIEEYNLHRFDTGAAYEGAQELVAGDNPDVDIIHVSPTVPKKEQSRAAVKKAQRQARSQKNARAAASKLPPTPAALEAPVLAPNEVIGVSLSRKVYEVNGVPFIYSEAGDTYWTIAEKYNLFPKEILKFNDTDGSDRLLPGTVVYIQNKKTQARKGIDKYVVEKDGENLRDICQKYAVRQKSVLKMNSFAAGQPLKEGDTIKLRKK